MVAVFVACRDHQQTRAHDSGERVRVDEAGGHAIGDAKVFLDLAQNHNPTIR